MAGIKGQCLNCGEALKDSMFSSNFPLRSIDVQLINKINNLQLAGACNKCGEKLRNESWTNIATVMAELRRDIERLLDAISLVSINQPANWSYRTIGLVTAQTVTGTGLFTDIASAFTDLVGAQSGAYNQKLRAAEGICRASLRFQTVELGGNAVLGVDVDYAEVGGQRAMLMVCMTGTAVELHNTDVVSDDLSQMLGEFQSKQTRLAELQALSKEVGIVS